jgi:hypothetical protein
MNKKIVAAIVATLVIVTVVVYNATGNYNIKSGEYYTTEEYICRYEGGGGIHSIAEAAAEASVENGVDITPRQVENKIKELNGMRFSTELLYGDKILVPTYHKVD